MTKIERFEAVERCLFWEEKKILIFGDLHLGYEEDMNEKGYSIPRTQLEDTLNLLKNIFSETGKIRQVILLGDIKHVFSGILGSEFRDVYKIIDLLEENLMVGGSIIITRGNHDNILEPVTRKYDNLQLVDSYLVEDVLFFHGNKENWGEFDKKIKLIVCGHFHPAISIKEGAKKERYKCFLLGKYNSKKLLIVPSFFPLVEGTDSSSGKLEDLDVSKFKVYVVADKVYDFGKIEKLN